MLETELISNELLSKEALGVDTRISWYTYALLLASTSIVGGVLWDISWHMSIGRDTFWSPPHMAIYLGGLVAGITSLIKIFNTTFTNSSISREKAVSFWGLRAPLGTLFCVWGAAAMITSAPFDDWWHDTYGLDVKILSPPHVLLALGIACIQLGAMLNVLALQNQKEREQSSENDVYTARLMFAYTAACFMTITYIFIIEYMGRSKMHNPLYYQVAALLPLALVAVTRGSRMKWPATTIAAMFMAIFILQLWLLPLFPAEPKLAPIKNKIDHMIPLPFPALLVIPALVADIVFGRIRNRSLWTQAAAAGSIYFCTFLLVQWVFAIFLISPFSRNWVFGAHYWPYYIDITSPYRFSFVPFNGDMFKYISGFFIAAVLTILSFRLGLAWGSWMRRVQR